MSFPSSFPSRTASHAPWSAWPGPRALLVMAVLTACGAVQAGEPADAAAPSAAAVSESTPAGPPLDLQQAPGIGRASGRERGEISGVAGSLKKKKQKTRD